MTLTQEDKAQLFKDTIQKVMDIFKLNGMSLLDAGYKLLSVIVQIYQQGVKDGKALK